MTRTIKLCMIGNPESIHVRRWARHFSQRGFDVSLLSYYQPRIDAESIGNATVHFMRARGAATRRAGPRSAAAMGRFPGLLRLVTAARLKSAGFYRELDRINPDVVHAYYVSDYGFLAALAGRHPLVVSAWGSDLLIDPGLSMITRRLVRWVLARSELVTYHADQLGEVARALGTPPERLLKVVEGVGPQMLKALKTRSVAPADRAPIILSQRSLDRPLYNVDVLINAMPEVLQRVPAARLVVVNDGALRGELEALARRLDVSGAVEFTGTTTWPDGIAEHVGKAAVYVSVPSSDGTSVAMLDAMAAGAYPIVSDIPANREWISAEGGTVVPVREIAPLAQAIVSALEQPARRAAAAKHNLDEITRRGLWETNMARMEEAYRGLVKGNESLGNSSVLQGEPAGPK